MMKILIIAGQTATGKTAFAVEMAKKFNGELISADSRQVYKGMDIVTGKDRDKIDVPIWLYDLAEPNESFSVSAWRKKALEAIENISARGKLPIVVGGTGLYLRSLTENLDTLDIPRDMELRNKNLSVAELQKILGQEKLVKMNQSDRLNPRRLIRAIEVASGETSVQCPMFNVQYLVLTTPPDYLKQRIMERVKQRIKDGAFSEFPKLTSLYSSDSEIWTRNEYQYARRQLTFFNKYFSNNHLDITNKLWKEQSFDILNSWIVNS